LQQRLIQEHPDQSAFREALNDSISELVLLSLLAPDGPIAVSRLSQIHSVLPQTAPIVGN
jgi:hypothetical protein